jgi:hypothetical protein
MLRLTCERASSPRSVEDPAGSTSRSLCSEKGRGACLHDIHVSARLIIRHLPDNWSVTTATIMICRPMSTSRRRCRDWFGGGCPTGLRPETGRVGGRLARLQLEMRPRAYRHIIGTHNVDSEVDHGSASNTCTQAFEQECGRHRLTFRRDCRCAFRQY